MIVNAEVIATPDFIRHHAQYGATDYYRDLNPKTGEIRWWCPIEAIIITELLYIQLEETFRTKCRLGILTSNQMSS